MKGAKYILVSLMVLSLAAATAQTVDKGKGSDKAISQEEDFYLPPLSALIDSAMIHSPLLKQQDQQLAIRQLELSRKRAQWLENLNLESYARYANNAQVVSGSFDTGISANLNTNTMQFLYGAGVTLKIPVFTFFSRGKDLRIAEHQIVAEQYQKEVFIREIRKTIIELYNQALLSHSLIDVKVNAMQTSSVAVERGEIEYKNSRINISDLSKLSDAHMKNQTEYEQALAQLRLSLELLKEISGYNFQTRQ